MINVYKDKSSGTYRYDFTIKNRRYRGAVKEARTLEQARLAAQSIWDTAFHGKYDPKGLKPAETPFNRFYRDRFLPHSKLHKKSYYDDVSIGNILCDFFGSEPIEGITWERVEQFKSLRSRTKTRSGGKRSPTTINRELSILSKAFTIAVKANVIRRNPCREVERFKTDNARSRFLSDEEEARLYEALGDHQMVKNVVTMALNTGMRQGEIFKLKWFDVDFTRGSIHVRRTKTGREALIDVKRQFDKARTAAGLEDFRFHDLRHTAATRMADHGASAFTIAAILGHSDIRMTSRYTHATDRATKAAVESLSGQSWSSFGQDLPRAVSVVEVSR